MSNPSGGSGEFLRLRSSPAAPGLVDIAFEVRVPEDDPLDPEDVVGAQQFADAALGLEVTDQLGHLAGEPRLQRVDSLGHGLGPGVERIRDIAGAGLGRGFGVGYAVAGQDRVTGRAQEFADLILVGLGGAVSG